MEVWFLFAMFGLKLPVLGLGYFLYRVIKRVDSQWENGGYDQPPGQDGGGGGGGGGGSPAPRPRPRPQGGLAARQRRRAPERTPSTGLRRPSPVRRPTLARTRVRTRSPLD